MKNISDILKYDNKVEIANTTNFLIDIKEKLNDLTQLVSMVENSKYNIVIYGFIKLDFIWLSQFERIGLYRYNVKNVFVRLIGLGFIEEKEKTKSDYETLTQNLGVKDCDYIKIKLYKLTQKGYDYIATEEILDSLNLILPKQNKQFILNTLQEMNK